MAPPLGATKAKKPLAPRAGGFFVKLEGSHIARPPMSTDSPFPMLPPRPEHEETRRGQRLLFLALLFAVLLNFPLLAVFDHEGRVGGVPVLYLYVMLMWILLVAVTGWLVKSIK